MPERSLVIGVGMHKTGTSSLAAALFALGYHVAGHEIPGIDYRSASDLEPGALREQVWSGMVEELKAHDAAQDTPWWAFYREIDRHRPGSRFVLTTRAPEAWLASVQQHFGRKSNVWDRWLFEGRNSVDDPQYFLDRYDRHLAEVRAYFADRPADLLEVDFSRDPRWGPICTFLGHPTPRYPFPHTNPATVRGGRVDRALRRVRRGLQERLGRGGPLTRSVAVWQRTDEVTRAQRGAVLASPDADVDELAARCLPILREMKPLIGLPDLDDGSGVEVDEAASAWTSLEFEIRYTLGQVGVGCLDRRGESGTVEAMAHAVLDRVERWTPASLDG